jgi:hypothetical protein
MQRQAPHSPSRRLLGAALLAVAGLSGCVVAPVGTYRQPYGGPYGGPYEGDVVPVPPPPPQYEVIGVAPVPGWLWISGYWGWRANRHVWIGGRWEAPRPGYRWTPHQWQQQGRGWREAPGGWSRR